MAFFTYLWFSISMPSPFKMHIKPAVLAGIIFMMIQVHPCTGNPLEKIISTSPSWQTFTNPDGTGLYHDILKAIFTPHKIKVIHQYTNATRGIYMVEKELADIYTCQTQGFTSPTLMLARYQMYENRFHAIFKKSTGHDFQGPASLDGKKVVWRRGYYKADEFKVKLIVFEADTGVSALDQVILGRADFYIDDQNLIKESIIGTTLFFDNSAFRIEPVGKRAYYPVFKASEKGKQIMELYDRGMEELHRSGRLKTIFKKWGHPYPEYHVKK